MQTTTEVKLKPQLQLHVPKEDNDTGANLALKPWPRTFGVEYEFLKCLERNPLGEMWKVRDNKGKIRLAQFLPHGVNEAVLQRLEFIQGNKGLAPLEVARRSTGQPILVSDLCPTLRERFEECWLQGLAGIPGGELIGHLRAAAEALDKLYSQYRVQHLALQPKNLVLDGGALKLAGFGVVEMVWAPTEQPLSYLNPRYSAPELFHNRIHGRSDQYSLALIFAELSTGIHPWKNNSANGGKLDLGLLSSREQEIIARALASNPADRFPSLGELVRALETALAAREKSHLLDALSPVIAYSAAGFSLPGTAAGSLDQFISELVLLAAGPSQVRDFNKIRYLFEPGKRLAHRCSVRTFPGAALLKLDGFRQQWRAGLVHQDEHVLVLSVNTPPSFWQKLTGRHMGLEIQIQLASPAGAKNCEVNVVIRPFGCGSKQAVRLLQEMGPHVLESLRLFLQAQPEQRSQERLLVTQPLRICPVIGGVELADPIDCMSKDVSAEGIGFYLEKPLTTPQVYISAPNVPEIAGYAGLAQVVRKQPHGDGCYEIGAAFNRDNKRPRWEK